MALEGLRAYNYDGLGMDDALERKMGYQKAINAGCALTGTTIKFGLKISLTQISEAHDSM